MTTPCSYLFVPGDRPERFAKAAAAGAHEVIFDLEDAVGPDDKAVARQNVVRWFADGGAGTVRVNGADTPWFAEDMAALADAAGAAIMLPKSHPASLEPAGLGLPGRSLIALIETVAGLEAVADVARAPGVVRLAFGNLDFGADARIPGTGPWLDPARFRIVMASRLAGLPSPIDGVTPDIRDEAALAADIERARAQGFAAKLCIHPAQVGPVNRGFAPTEAEVDWARRIARLAAESGGAVVQMDGKMVDRPVIERARAILAAAGA